jgi:hypothetical protein
MPLPLPSLPAVCLSVRSYVTCHTRSLDISSRTLQRVDTSQQEVKQALPTGGRQSLTYAPRARPLIYCKRAIPPLHANRCHSTAGLVRLAASRPHSLTCASRATSSAPPHSALMCQVRSFGPSEGRRTRSASALWAIPSGRSATCLPLRACACVCRSHPCKIRSLALPACPPAATTRNVLNATPYAHVTGASSCNTIDAICPSGGCHFRINTRLLKVVNSRTKKVYCCIDADASASGEVQVVLGLGLALPAC